MQNGLGISVKSFVIFKVNVVVKKFSIYCRKIHDSMLKSFVEIEFEICIIYEAEYAKKKVY